MTNIGFIPARGGSKGIKKKNIIPIFGKPLIWWACNALQNSVKIDKFIVATDSDEIEEVVRSFNFSKLEIYRRSSESASDMAPTVDVILEYINFSSLKEDDILCLVQTTSPMVISENVNEAVSLYNKDRSKSVDACVEFPRICWDKNGNPLGHNPQKRQRRQEMDKVLVENGAIYVNSVENILRERSLLTEQITPYIMEENTISELDEPKDIPVVEDNMRKKYSPDFSKFKIFLTDCDGVLTDGGMYYSEEGEACKKFNTTDGFGIKKLVEKGFYVAIVTAEKTKFAKLRADKLGIDCYLGTVNKEECIRSIAEDKGVSLSEIVYIGDDIIDIPALKSVGYSVCPNNAQPEVKACVNYITRSSGGDGAVREIINIICSD